MSELGSKPYTLIARAGDTFARVIEWFENDGVTPIDLTGSSVEWSLVSGDTETQYVDAVEASITNAIASEIRLVLTPSQTRALFGRLWRTEVTVTLADASRETLLHGFLSIEREVLP